MLYINKDSNILKDYLTYSDSEYPSVIYKKRHENDFIEVPFIISENDGVYTWIYIRMMPYNYHYRGLVDAIIHTKYDESEISAITFNYMDDPNNDKYRKKFKEFQDWRKLAKEYSKKHFNM